MNGTNLTSALDLINASPALSQSAPTVWDLVGVRGRT
jgi:hypothetical protein